MWNGGAGGARIRFFIALLTRFLGTRRPARKVHYRLTPERPDGCVRRACVSLPENDNRATMPPPPPSSLRRSAGPIRTPLLFRPERIWGLKCHRIRSGRPTERPRRRTNNGLSAVSGPSRTTVASLRDGNGTGATARKVKRRRSFSGQKRMGYRILTTLNVNSVRRVPCTSRVRLKKKITEKRFLKTRNKNDFINFSYCYYFPFFLFLSTGSEKKVFRNQVILITVFWL